MRNFLVLFSVIMSSSLAAAPSKEAEGLYVRRIVELWKGGDHDVAKEQTQEFLEKYPQSAFRDRLMFVAADHEWSQEHYAEAAKFYDQIKSEDFLKASLDRRVDALHRLDEHDQILTVLVNHLPEAAAQDLTDQDALRIYYFAEALASVSTKTEDAELSQKIAEEALTYYARLKDSKVAAQAKLSLAGVFAQLKRNQEAVPLYLSLAKDFPENRETLILRAAQLQTEYDPDGAIETMALLQQTDRKTEGAVFSQVFLLFNAGRYQELLDRRNELLENVTEQQRPLLDFFLGRAAFAVGRYGEAVAWFEPLLKESSMTSSPANEKVILFTLIAGLHHLQRPDAAQPLLVRFEQSFPKDPSLNRLLLSQSILYRSKGNVAEALDISNRIVDKMSSTEDTERALFQKIACLYDLGRCRDCHQCGENFVKAFPNSSLNASVNKLMCQMTAKRLQEADLVSDERQILQARLSQELGSSLRTKGILLPNERSTFLLQLAKSEFAQQHFHGAMVVVNEFLEDFPGDEQAYQAHLILAYCYLKDDTELAKFISHAEMALKLEPDFPDKDAIHSNLFGAHLKLAQAAERNSQEALQHTEAGAEHLYTLYSLGSAPVKPESLRWLAYHYYSQLSSGNDILIRELPNSPRRVMAQRAALALHTAIHQATPNTGENLKDHVVLSRLYGWLGLEEQRRQFLEQVLARSWSDDRETRQQLAHLRLELGQRYELIGDTKKALHIYEKLINESADSDAYVRDAAQLQLMRTRFFELPESRRSIDNPEVVVILNTLQGLQTRRTLAHEPVHLEAAWERALISGLVAGPVSSDDVTLANLKQAKREIVSQDDIVSRDYHSGRQEHEEKDRIFQAYLMLFDARIAQLEGQQAALRQKFQEQKSKLKVAEILYSTLIQGNFAVSNYLVAQAQKGLDEISALNTL